MTQRTILLDTNILLCALIAPERLDADIQTQLSDAENTVYFSAASICSEGGVERRFARQLVAITHQLQVQLR